MARWLTMRQFCAVYQMDAGTVSRNLISNDTVIYTRTGTGPSSEYRILDPGQEFMAVYKRDYRYIPFIRSKEAAAMIGESPDQIRHAVARGEIKRRTKEMPHYSLSEVEAMYKLFHGEKSLRPEIVRWGIDLLEKQVGHEIEVSEEVRKEIAFKPKKTSRLDRYGGKGSSVWVAGHNPLWCRGNYAGEEPIEICWDCINWAFTTLINKTEKAELAKVKSIS